MLQPLRLTISIVAAFAIILLFLTHSFLPNHFTPSPAQLASSNASTDVSPLGQAVDWSRFAIFQYATNTAHLCNSAMMFERLHTVNSKVTRLLVYNNQYSPDVSDSAGFLLRKMRDEYNAVLKPIDVLHKDTIDATWSDGFTKFLAFNQTEYDRVLCLDSDATVLQSMDELFLLPPAIVALPRSYWEPQAPHLKLSAQVILFTPSAHEFDRCKTAIEAAPANDYDMEIVNALYGDIAIVIPHKIYDLSTGEFRGGPNHTPYYGFEDPDRKWNPDEAVAKAKYIHFSDWPVPKPWIPAETDIWEEALPKCFDEHGHEVEGDIAVGGGKDEAFCRDRELWVHFYKDFRDRRESVCQGNDALWG